LAKSPEIITFVFEECNLAIHAELFRAFSHALESLSEDAVQPSGPQRIDTRV